ncbi:Poly(ADP-ribose) glycohydrolase [Cynara cardunculus var. scolymus]|uniref:poly(ADP-ribose) glycohydrolase n=1 Tax=Cynara cardunculus var. scolymus TaxID=59895 RepID=A0A103Y0T6_CYNCS|nr:Poly(ADP-ribose) glycohydrolase [Cynara cardunculus var. scolymus]
MENREDLNSILEFLPVVLRSTALFWPSQVVKALKALSKGPEHSKVDSGEVLFLAISDIRRSLNLSAGDLAFSTADGFSLFFDDLFYGKSIIASLWDGGRILFHFLLLIPFSFLLYMHQLIHEQLISRAEANKWFREILPALADSLLRLPGMLEAHYQSADSISCIGARNGLKMGLRLLKSQEAGIVLLSKELIGALLACSFFCLFPNSCRGANHLQVINFDHLFASLYDSYNEKQENKIKCIIHYFERISSSTPVGNVSFERKVLAADHNLKYIFSPKTESWSKSVVSLCLFEVCSSGLIEDHSKEALEVDFANKYFGGGALARGCVQVCLFLIPDMISRRQVTLAQGVLAVACCECSWAIQKHGENLYGMISNMEYQSLKNLKWDYGGLSSSLFIVGVTVHIGVTVHSGTPHCRRNPSPPPSRLHAPAREPFSGLRRPSTFRVLFGIPVCCILVLLPGNWWDAVRDKYLIVEEIRFMINPELIAGMLFLPSMADNEAIEVVGAERFSKYTGYAASFQYCGDFLDKKDIDIIGRRKIRIIAIDALFNPGERQYEHEFLVREVNKAFCGFSDPCKSQRYQMLFEDNELSEAQLEQDLKSVNSKSDNAVEICQPVGFQDEIGIVTGNWGCGAFGGDPELKAMLQWLAASQALRPFMVYYTFDIEALQKLEQVTQWINFHKWSVGDLWNMLVEYSSQRSKKETQVGFFNWLLPLLSSDDPMMLDVP